MALDAHANFASSGKYQQPQSHAVFGHSPPQHSWELAGAGNPRTPALAIVARASLASRFICHLTVTWIDQRRPGVSYAPWGHSLGVVPELISATRCYQSLISIKIVINLCHADRLRLRRFRVRPGVRL
jgi:hypothetical protein